MAKTPSGGSNPLNPGMFKAPRSETLAKTPGPQLTAATAVPGSPEICVERRPAAPAGPVAKTLPCAGRHQQRRISCRTCYFGMEGESFVCYRPVPPQFPDTPGKVHPPPTCRGQRGSLKQERRPSASMSHVPERRRRTGGEEKSRPKRQTIMG